MDTTDRARDGFGKFEETAHDLEQAAAEKSGRPTNKARSKSSGLAALADAVRSRPVTSLLVACAAGYTLSWLHQRG